MLNEISEGSYMVGASYPNKLHKVAATLASPGVFIVAILYSLL